MPAKLAIDPDNVTTLLMRGFTPPMIAQRLGISDDTVLRIIAKPRDDYEPADRPADVWRGARATAARLLMALGIRQKEIADLMSVTRRAVQRYVREVAPCGEPLIELRLNEQVTGQQGERVDKGVYRVVSLPPRVALVGERKQGKQPVHFVSPDTIQGKVSLVSRSLYEVAA